MCGGSEQELWGGVELCCTRAGCARAELDLLLGADLPLARKSFQASRGFVGVEVLL